MKTLISSLLAVAIFVIALTVSIVQCFAGDIHLSDSCRRPYPADSLTLSCGIQYDSCSTNFPMDSHFWYSKKCYTIFVRQSGAFHLPSYRYDTTVLVSWQQIDTAFATIRNGFQSLEDRAGGFVMRKVNPDDSLEFQFELIFEQYCSVDSIEKLLLSIPNIVIAQLPWLDIVSVNNSEDYDANTTSVKSFPIPATDRIILNTGLSQIVTEAIIYSALGTGFHVPAVMLSNGLELDIAALPSGVYSAIIDKHFFTFLVKR